jgi:hypothetical protein
MRGSEITSCILSNVWIFLWMISWWVISIHCICLWLLHLRMVCRCYWVVVDIPFLWEIVLWWEWIFWITTRGQLKLFKVFPGFVIRLSLCGWFTLLVNGYFRVSGNVLSLDVYTLFACLLLQTRMGASGWRYRHFTLIGLTLL